jgi:hypothetical protein
MVLQVRSHRKQDHVGKKYPYRGARRMPTIVRVPLFMLSHSHAPGECRTAFAAWKGFDSPLRHTLTLTSCVEGGHHAWWRVEAADAEAALAQLPPFVAERTVVEPAREVRVP